MYATHPDDEPVSLVPTLKSYIFGDTFTAEPGPLSQLMIRWMNLELARRKSKFILMSGRKELGVVLGAVAYQGVCYGVIRWIGVPGENSFLSPPFTPNIDLILCTGLVTGSITG